MLKKLIDLGIVRIGFETEMKAKCKKSKEFEKEMSKIKFVWVGRK